MSEVLSRGRRVDNGRWVEGFYVHLHDGVGNESHRVYTGHAECDYGDFYPDWCEVEPDTVSRFTGIYDRCGKRIFEGDIVEEYDGFGNVGRIGIVAWNELFAGWHTGKPKSMYGSSVVSSYKIIGNVYDEREEDE